MVRDARDVALSEYAFETARSHFPANLDAFLKGFVRGKVNPFGSWQNNVNSWLDSPLNETEGLLLIRFEELRRHTEQTLARIVEFLNVNVSPKTLQQAIENNSLQRMQEKEDRQPGFRAMANAGERFVRSGAVGGWKSKLNESQVRMIEIHCGAALSLLGYSIASSPAVTQPADAQILQPLPHRLVRQ